MSRGLWWVVWERMCLWVDVAGAGWPPGHPAPCCFIADSSSGSHFGSPRNRVRPVNAIELEDGLLQSPCPPDRPGCPLRRCLPMSGTCGCSHRDTSMCDREQGDRGVVGSCAVFQGSAEGWSVRAGPTRTSTSAKACTWPDQPCHQYGRWLLWATGVQEAVCGKAVSWTRRWM